MLDDDELKLTWDLTSKAYDDACRKVGYNNNELRSQVLDWEITDKEAIEKRDALDEVYRDIICKFPSHILQNIYTANENGQQRRAAKTIDNIATELLERELNKDGTN